MSWGTVGALIDIVEKNGVRALIAGVMVGIAGVYAYQKAVPTQETVEANTAEISVLRSDMTALNERVRRMDREICLIVSVDPRDCAGL